MNHVLVDVRLVQAMQNIDIEILTRPPALSVVAWG